MIGDWIILPPWTDEQGPTNISLGSLIREDFGVVEYISELEVETTLCWSELSRQEVANIRNLISSNDFKDLLFFYNYGTSTGTEINMGSDKDPNDAKFSLTIHSKQSIPQPSMSRIVNLIKNYKVH